MFQAVEALCTSLKRGCTVEYLRCKHCSAAHLDEGELSTKEHFLHSCNVCSKQWMHPTAVQGNPLALLSPQLQGNVLHLVFTSSVGSMLASEPTWLAQVYTQQ